MPPLVETWQYGDPGRPYVPEPPQHAAHQAYDAKELLYGGAAGGGKTEFLIAAAVFLALRIPGSASIIFRRTFPDLKRTIIPRMLAKIPKTVATYHHTDHTWTFKNGSTIELAYLRKETDVLNYQGAEYQLIIFDELTQFTEFQFDYMATRARAAGAVLALMQAAGVSSRIIGTTNPGGPGHHWVKARFVDPAPWGATFTVPPTKDQPKPRTRRFIPAKLADNPHMDPSYEDTLDAIPDPDLRRALRDGDWDVLQGVRFKQWRRALHVVDAGMIDLPLVDYPRIVAVDWGIDAPWCALWMGLLPDGLVYVYRELYQAGLTSEEQCRAILAAEAEGERAEGRPLPLIMDPAMWARQHTSGSEKPLDPDTPPPGSVAATYRRFFGPSMRKANNSRIDGWAAIDELLRVRRDGLPRLLVSELCPNLIRTLPALPRSTKRPEDVDTDAEDHAPDALRYGVMELAGGGKRRVTTTVTRRAAPPVTGSLASTAF
ncbi:terminase large subunit domain-containing protein [Nakamurella leprariae]|uniref:Terminase family protein n=1 Tax=Nakamurella leprariae TaxID=2803911 RepID=A0A938YG81_9ACTN|nr:terminase family protein [Nakamurella leprariae]MBM9467253.1 terminase family protein [Nakamurella leprariae]